MKKYNLLFDGKMLEHEFCNDSVRSGIFMVAKNIFNELLKRKDINVYIWDNNENLQYIKKYLKLYNLEHVEIFNERINGYLEKLKNYARDLKNSYPKNEHPYLRTNAILLYNIASVFCLFKKYFINPYLINKKFTDIDFYFSPYEVVPNEIKKSKNILASVYLYDTIPLLIPEYKNTDSKTWFNVLVKNFSQNEIYFADSICAKNDFLKFIPELTDKQITIAYLAASETFRNLKNDEKIQNIKEKYNIPQGKYIFSLCTLEPRKNLIFTIKNFIEFIKNNSIEDLYFVLGGYAWEKFLPILDKEISDLDKYKSKIIKAGYVDDEDLPYLYSNAFCFTYISKYEGFGLPVLEAMQCGVPVITSNTSSLPEVIGDAGIQINPYSDEECINAFETLYFDNGKRDYYANKGLERAKEFSWEKCVDIIVETFKKRKQSNE